MKYIIICLFCITSSASNLIYNENDTSSYFPIEYYLNSTFDVIQNPNWFNQKDFKDKHTEVWRRLKNPDKSIRKDGGYRKLIDDEIFSGRVAPNIALHTLGNSYDTREVYEYFRAKNLPYAPAWTFLLTFAAHIGNEALETSQTDEINSHDHIADIYFFDIIGFSLAFNESYLKYMLDDMGMESWHFQPAWDIKHSDVFNAGLNYIYRPKYFEGNLRPIIYTGMQNMGGLSYYKNPNNIYSLLAGISLTNPLRQKGRFVVGLFHENSKGLSSSLFINGSENYKWRVNIYPKKWKNLKAKNIDLGLIFAEDENRNFALGASVNMPFSLGLAHI